MISFKKKIFDVSSIVSQLRSETRNVQLTQHVAAILIIRGRKVKHWGVAFDHKGYISALLDRRRIHTFSACFLIHNGYLKGNSEKERTSRNNGPTIQRADTFLAPEVLSFLYLFCIRSEHCVARTMSVFNELFHTVRATLVVAA